MEQAHHEEGWLRGSITASIGHMEDELIVKALRDKRAEIHGRITAYEAQIEQAKHDLAHVNATLRLFTDVEKQRARYVVSHGFFRKGEIADLCALQLQDGSELTTRALAERVMRARDLDATDATLRNSVVSPCGATQARRDGREAEGNVHLVGRPRNYAARCQ
jgi:hypothetical protein